MLLWLGCQSKCVMLLKLHSLVAFAAFAANFLHFVHTTSTSPLGPTCHSQSWHLSRRRGGWKVNSSAEVSFWGNRGAADIRKIKPTKFQATEFGDTWYVKYWIQMRLLPLYILTNMKYLLLKIWIFCWNFCSLCLKPLVFGEKIRITRVKSPD